METRTIIETKLYFLSLQHILDGAILPIVAFEDYSKLEEWVESQKKRWTDIQEGKKIIKRFKQGSILEWYLPPKSMEPIEHPSRE